MTEPDHVRSARSVYDATAEMYASAVGTDVNDSFEGAIDRGLLSAFAEFSLQTPGPVADVGCGPGRVAAFLAAQTLDAVGVDVSRPMLDIARRTHPGIPFLEGQLASLPFADGSLAGATYWYSIIHTPASQLVEVFVEAARVVADGGRILVAFQAGDGVPVDRVDAHGTGFTLTNHRHAPDDVNRSMVEAGLHVQMTTIRNAELAHETTPQAFLIARKDGDSGG